jgi:hypothetical protein
MIRKFLTSIPYNQPSAGSEINPKLTDRDVLAVVDECGAIVD